MHRSILITLLSTIFVIVALACMLAIVLGVILGLNRKDESLVQQNSSFMVTTFSETTKSGANATTRTNECESDWVFYNQHCYRLYTDNKTWSEAQAVCISQRANLVKIDNSGEFSFLIDFFMTNKTTNPKIWVGASSTEVLRFRWLVDNTRLSEFSPFWCLYEPNNDGYYRMVSQNIEPCVEIRYSSVSVYPFCFNDYRCNFKLSYICETV